MKTVAKISGLNRETIGDIGFNRLTSVAADKVQTPNSVRFSINVDDPALQQVLDIIENLGLHRCTNTSLKDGDKKSFSYTLHREYDESDLDQCELLEFNAVQGAYNGIERTNNGEALILEWLMPGDVELRMCDFFSGYSQSTWIFFPDRVKALLEVRLQQLICAETLYWPTALMTAGIQSVRDRSHREYWELDSDLVLPPVSGAMDLRDDCGNSISEKNQRVRVFPRDGFYARPELRYQAVHLPSLGSFDIARTYENFGLTPSREYHRRFSTIVVSNRFYQLCKANRLRADWTPVRIERN